LIRLAILLLLAFPARAELALEAGAAVLRGEAVAGGLSWTQPLGPVRAEVGVLWADQTIAYAMAWDRYRALELGLGAAHIDNPAPYTCHATAALGVRYRSARWSVQWRHFSTWQSCSPNYGRDLLTVAWRL
jgi:hypothetical protein